MPIQRVWLNEYVDIGICQVQVHVVSERTLVWSPAYSLARSLTAYLFDIVRCLVLKAYVYSGIASDNEPIQ